MEVGVTAIEPIPRPPHGPFVLDGEAELWPTIHLGMKIQTPILCEPLTFGGVHFHGLVVKFVSFCKCIALGYAFEAANSPKIFGELCYGVGHQLMQLRLKLEQDIS
jgi:hypothetical protein